MPFENCLKLSEPVKDWGVAHGDDAMYFARMNLKGQQFVVTENDKKFVDIYQKLITNFARYLSKYLDL